MSPSEVAITQAVEEQLRESEQPHFIDTYMASNGSPIGYEEKFENFIKLCNESPEQLVFIHNPTVLGDNYDELIESLNRLADAEKHLAILPRNARK